MTPARVTPMPLPYDSASARALAGGVLVDGEQRRRAAAFDVELADAVARRLRRDHRDVDVRRRRDRAEADVEAVREHQHLAGGQVRRDLAAVEPAWRCVSGTSTMITSAHFGHLGHRVDGQPRRRRLLARPAGRGQPDPHVHAAVLQVQRVRMALRSVADDRHLLAADQREVGVVVVVHRCWLGHLPGLVSDVERSVSAEVQAIRRWRLRRRSSLIS